MQSTELQRQVRRYTIAKKATLVVKYIGDNRYESDAVVTHDKIAIPAVAAKTLQSIKSALLDKDIKVIGIDEGQFFPDIVPVCNELVDHGKIIIIAALDGTFQRQPFGSILELIPLADEVVKLNAICAICGNDAPFSKRISNEQEVQVIGGSDKYISTCRHCYQLATPVDCGCLTVA